MGPGTGVDEAHSSHEAAEAANPRNAASAERLGPHFQRLVASVRERKAPQTSDYSGRTYSNPVFAAAALSDSLRAVKARSARAAGSSSNRRLSEDTMTSTAATRHPRSSAVPGQPKQEVTGANHDMESEIAAGGTKQAHQAGPVSSMCVKPCSESGMASRHAVSIRKAEHGEQILQRLQLTNAITAAQSKQVARRHRGICSTPVTDLALGPAVMSICAARAPAREAAAAYIVTPADISAEATEQVCLNVCSSPHTLVISHDTT